MNYQDYDILYKADGLILNLNAMRIFGKQLTTIKLK